MHFINNRFIELEFLRENAHLLILASDLKELYSMLWILEIK
jgi:hypothetical protein